MFPKQISQPSCSQVSQYGSLPPQYHRVMEILFYRNNLFFYFPRNYLFSDRAHDRCCSAERKNVSKTVTDVSRCVACLSLLALSRLVSVSTRHMGLVADQGHINTTMLLILSLIWMMMLPSKSQALRLIWARHLFC